MAAVSCHGAEDCGSNHLVTYTHAFDHVGVLGTTGLSYRRTRELVKSISLFDAARSKSDNENLHIYPADNEVALATYSTKDSTSWKGDKTLSPLNECT